ncbi:hypothetical protein CUZ56_00850 [Saezia sanguinis]|uniref:Uncharacterized protein n=1 Tax=Saezia sanguinis TaxID=1965230 RepID=A0A433SHX3_9BURK|nr:hypothetical protein [Saezia sanguinis]RUS68359.1 hypothetical protein CUZ56_00850 [Saezia sanguinis]
MMLKLSICLRNAIAMFALVLAFTVNSFAQEATMERFDIEAFKRNLIEHNGVFLLPDGTKIRQFEISEGGYIEDRIPPQSAYTYRKLFNAQGQLMATTQEFYSFFVGTTKRYDGHGNVIKEESEDDGFEFSVEDLAAKMLADYQIDIMNSDNVYRLARGIYSTDPLVSYYLVDCYDHTSPAPDQAVIAFLVNGTTGEVLHMIHTNTMRPASVIDAYFQKLADTPKEGQ